MSEYVVWNVILDADCVCYNDKRIGWYRALVGLKYERVFWVALLGGLKSGWYMWGSAHGCVQIGVGYVLRCALFSNRVLLATLQRFLSFISRPFLPSLLPPKHDDAQSEGCCSRPPVRWEGLKLILNRCNGDIFLDVSMWLRPNSSSESVSGLRFSYRRSDCDFSDSSSRTVSRTSSMSNSWSHAGT